MKVAISKDYGGFYLTQEMLEWLRDIKAWSVTTVKDGKLVDPSAKLFIRVVWPSGDKRLNTVLNQGDIKLQSDPNVIEVIELFGVEDDSLKIVEVPNDVEVTIESYDGVQWIAEKCRTWC